MALPLVLAGPILRRVEPTLVSVWLALDRSAAVSLTLWQGRVKAGAADARIRSDPATPTLRIGERLHVAMALLKIPAASDKTLQPGTLYSYDVEIVEGGGARHTLASIGLLKNGPNRNGGAEPLARPHVALGYDDDFLPSFALPPQSLNDLRIVYGSCRRPVNEHPDAMAWIDDFIVEGERFGKPLERPHHLVLGGDQIYADDVWAAHLQMVNVLANELIGRTPDASGEHGPWGGKPVEHLVVSHAERRTGSGTPPTYAAANGDAMLPAGLAEFPAGRRQPLVLREAQMTTVDGESHLLSFGEFAAMYLMVWSNACWPEEAQWPALEPLLNAFDTPPLRPRGGLFLAPRATFAELTELEKDALRQAHGKRVEQLRAFVAGLPKVRRTLANVPTYMIFDDHDVTDDWNLNPIWYDRVYTTPLGRQIVRNALASYAVFQDWGNDPLRYENERDDPGPKGDPRRLLQAVARMFPKGASDGPATGSADAPAETLDRLLGIGLRPDMQLEGHFKAVSPPIKWHFSVSGPKHLMVAIDNRTRRSFLSRNGPPGNVDVAALEEMIPAALPPGKEILIVVAPLQVLGPAILDELIAPATYRLYDAIGYRDLNERQKDPDTGDEIPPPKPGIGTRRMAGTNPDAIEAWSFDAATFEALLARLSVHRRVVLLSGDVHYTAANAMSYWTKGRDDAARIVQFTGSGFKNVMPWYIGAVDRVLSFAQQMIRSDIGADRMGWNAKTDGVFDFPEGAGLGDVPPALRRRLAKSPMLLPTHGWPEGTAVLSTKLPDWSWRVAPVLDTRADEQRPAGGRPPTLEPDASAIERLLSARDASGDELAAYQSVASRHQAQFDRLRHARQMMFRANFAVLRFDAPVEGEAAPGPVAVHEVYTVVRDPDQPASVEPLPQAFMVQRASLTASADEVRPELGALRPPAF